MMLDDSHNNGDHTQAIVPTTLDLVPRARLPGHPTTVGFFIAVVQLEVMTASLRGRRILRVTKRKCVLLA